MQEYVSDLLRQWHLQPWAWNLIIVGIAVVLGLLLNALLSLLVRSRRSGGDETGMKRSYFRHMVHPLSVFLPLVVFNLLLPVMRIDRILLTRFDHAVEIALIVAFAWLLIRLSRAVQDFVNRKVDIHSTADNLRQRRLITQLMYVRRVFTAIIILLTIGAVLLTFETMRKLGTGLLTGVGIGGIIIGFAAQRSLGNLLAGFQIAFTQPIRIDDEVIVNNQFGIIEEITLTYVVVKSWDERRIILPINFFIEQPFENWTRTTSAMHSTVFFYTDYRLPVDWLRTEFLKAVKEHPLWDGRTASLVVVNLKEAVMEIRGLVSARSSGNAFDLRCFLRERIIQRIAESHPDCLPLTRAELLPQASGAQTESTAAAV